MRHRVHNHRSRPAHYEARTESVTDPTGLSPALVQPAGLTATGVGSIMTAAARVRSMIGPGPVPPNGNMAVNLVAVHGVATPDGRLSETEVLATSDPSLNQTALDWGRRSRLPDRAC